MHGNGYVYGVVWDSKHETIKPLQCLLDVTPFKLALPAKCTIHDVGVSLVIVLLSLYIMQ
jgi:hypothetical protein